MVKKKKAVPPPAQASFSLAYEVDLEVRIDEKVFEAVLTDEWRSRFYQLRTREDVARHLTFNLLQGRSLSSLDGFADLSDDLVDVVDPQWELVSFREERKGQK